MPYLWRKVGGVMDINIRDCGRVGYLGIIAMVGREIYRTGEHHPTAAAALQAVEKWRAYHGEEISSHT
jgi:hypothetical protein